MKKLFAVVSGLGATLMASSAFAVLDANVSAVTTAMDTLIADLTTWGWAAILAILSFTIGAKLVKKFFGKAT